MPHNQHVLSDLTFGVSELEVEVSEFYDLDVLEGLEDYIFDAGAVRIL